MLDLHERLLTATPAVAAAGHDPFSELKERIHLSVINDLGPQLFNVNMDPNATWPQ